MSLCEVASLSRLSISHLGPLTPEYGLASQLSTHVDISSTVRDYNTAPIGQIPEENAIRHQFGGSVS